MRNQMIAAVSMLVLAAGQVVAQAKPGGDGPRWSAMGSVGVPVGDLANTSKLGFSAEVGAEWNLSSGWGIRPNLGYNTFAGKTFSTAFGNFPLPAINILAVGVDFVHRTDSKLYVSVGAGYYNLGCSGCESEWKPAARAAIGWALDSEKRFSLEGGITNLFTSGSNATWVPVGIRVAF